jgi:hypothetical protein
MGRYPLLNLCFVILVITLLAIQHSVTVFGPGAHGGAVSRSDRSDALILHDKLSRRLRVPANFGRAAGLFNDFWRRGLVFKEWWMEYNASQWELFNASSPAETDLLEARFHVANAEVFTDAMSEKDRAINELARAEKSLEAARTIVKPALTPQLAMVREEIAAAEIKEQTEGAFGDAPFETIKANLDHLIEILRLSKT